MGNYMPSMCTSGPSATPIHRPLDLVQLGQRTHSLTQRPVVSVADAECAAGQSSISIPAKRKRRKYLPMCKNMHNRDHERSKRPAALRERERGRLVDSQVPLGGGGVVSGRFSVGSVALGQIMCVYIYIGGTHRTGTDGVKDCGKRCYYSCVNPSTIALLACR